MTIQNDSAVVEMSLVITKTSYDKAEPDPNKKRRIMMVNSDTAPDLYEESMSIELYKDFVNHVTNNDPVPDVFKSAICEDGVWCGGTPYLSIAHYRAGRDGKNVPGSVESIYVDGEKLKSKAYLHDTSLGRKLFETLQEDMEKHKSGTLKEPVRVSIGFLDLEHVHEVNGKSVVFTRKSLGQKCSLCESNAGGKIYKKGYLVHLAATRKPVNPRTEMGVEEKSMGEIVTKQDDAASIIGEDLAKELEQKSLTDDDVLVTKSEDLEERVYAIRSAFYDKFSPPPQSYPYIAKIMDDSVIVRDGEKLYKAEYSVDGDTVKFGEKKSWQEVEVGFTPKSRVLWESENGETEKRMSSLETAVKSLTDVVTKSLEKLQGTQTPVVEESMDTEVIAKAEEKEEPKVEVKTEVVVASEKSVLDTKFEELKSVLAGSPTQEQLQAAFNAVGQEVEKVYVPPAPNANDIAEIVKSAVEAAVAPLKMQLATLQAGVQVQKSVSQNPVTRALTLTPAELTQRSVQPKRQLTQIEQIALRSTGASV